VPRVVGQQAVPPDPQAEAPDEFDVPRLFGLAEARRQATPRLGRRRIRVALDHPPQVRLETFRQARIGQPPRAQGGEFVQPDGALQAGRGAQRPSQIRDGIGQPRTRLRVGPNALVIGVPLCIVRHFFVVVFDLVVQRGQDGGVQDLPDRKRAAIQLVGQPQKKSQNGRRDQEGLRLLPQTRLHHAVQPDDFLLRKNWKASRIPKKWRERIDAHSGEGVEEAQGGLDPVVRILSVGFVLPRVLRPPDLRHLRLVVDPHAELAEHDGEVRRVFLVPLAVHLGRPRHRALHPPFRHPAAFQAGQQQRAQRGRIAAFPGLPADAVRIDLGEVHEDVGPVLVEIDRDVRRRQLLRGARIVRRPGIVLRRLRVGFGFPVVEDDVE